jgi:hypothetical protein
MNTSSSVYYGHRQPLRPSIFWACLLSGPVPKESKKKARKPVITSEVPVEKTAISGFTYQQAAVVANSTGSCVPFRKTIDIMAFAVPPSKTVREQTAPGPEPSETRMTITVWDSFLDFRSAVDDWATEQFAADIGFNFFESFESVDAADDVDSLEQAYWEDVLWDDMFGHMEVPNKVGSRMYYALAVSKRESERRFYDKENRRYFHATSHHCGSPRNAGRKPFRPEHTRLTDLQFAEWVKKSIEDYLDADEMIVD